MKDESLQIILKEFSFFHEQFNIIHNQFNLFHKQFNLIQEQFNQIRSEIGEIGTEINEIRTDINGIKGEMKLLVNKVGECVQTVKDFTNFNFITENDLKRFAKANNLEFKYN